MTEAALPVLPLSGTAWRLVETQHRVSTMKLVDDIDQQVILEELLDASKPPVPTACAHLHYLMFTPFRYVPRHDSRFARQGSEDRAFYAAEHVATAVAEIAFHRLLFFAESPGTPLPSNPLGLVAFSIRYATERALDLTAPPLDTRRDDWLATEDYAACQALASRARTGNVEVLRSVSARDPGAGANLTLLSCAAFVDTRPTATHEYRMLVRPTVVTALAVADGSRLSFPVTDFAADSRLTTR